MITFVIIERGKNKRAIGFVKGGLETRIEKGISRVMVHTFLEYPRDYGCYQVDRLRVLSAAEIEIYECQNHLQTWRERNGKHVIPYRSS